MPAESSAQSEDENEPQWAAFSMTSTTTARYRGDNYDANPYDDDFFSLQQRFDLAAQMDEFRLEVRADGFLPTSVFTETCPEGEEVSCYLTWDARVERARLSWTHGDWGVDVGDSQLVLGRGLALSFRKVDLLGVDNALRGAHARYETSNFRVRLHAGTANPQNQDPINLKIIRDPDDVVIAGQVNFVAPDVAGLNVGLHAVHVAFEDDFENILVHRNVDVAGWSVEVPALFDGALSLYGEANGLRRTYDLIDTPQHDWGRGIYASAQVQTGDLTVLVEWKDYDNFLVAPTTTESNPWRIYSALPTTEYEGPQRIRAIGNQRGGSVRVDYAFLPGPWSFSVNSSLYGVAEEMNVDPWDGILVTHSWATLSRRQEYGEDVVWTLTAIGGYRRETFLHDPFYENIGWGDLDRRMAHGQIEATVGIGDHAFDLNVDHRFETQLDGNRRRDFEVGGASLTYSWGLPLALSLGLRWSDFKPGEVTARELKDYNFLGGLWYPSVEVRWSFDPGTSLRLFVGQTPGGQICSGGVCRDVPPFEGALLQFVGRL